MNGTPRVIQWGWFQISVAGCCSVLAREDTFGDADVLARGVECGASASSAADA